MSFRCVFLGLVCAFGAIAAPAFGQGLVGSCLCDWDNGAHDALSGQLSVETPGGESVGAAADDFFLLPGKLHAIEAIHALLLTNDPEPDAVLHLYRDCNGSPGDLVGIYPATGALDTGINNAAFDLYEFVFDLDGCRLVGGQFYWVSARGVRDAHELYYAPTSGNGQAQGAQAHFIVPEGGFPEWTKLEYSNVGKSDLAFAVCSTPCDILFDNGHPNFTAQHGIDDNLALPNYRAADDFALPNCTDWHIDTVRLCVLSNCDVSAFRIEIFDTDPSLCLPNLTPLWVLDDPKVNPLGVSVPTMEGMPQVVDAYELQFADLEVMLEGGLTYWVAVSHIGPASAGDRAYVCESFDCNKDSLCQIKINPSAFFKPSVGAWEEMGSFLGDSVERSLAIQVCGQRLRQVSNPDAEGPGGRPCDWNEDGFVNAQDWFDWANDYFSAVGPRGNADYNGDGFENAQDWFDFVNCFEDRAGGGV